MARMHESRPTPWRTVILVCRKCGKKLKGGFGPNGKHGLRSELRQALRDAGRRDVKIIETGCLGLCPKQGVTALNASCPGTIHVISAGTQPEAALRTLRVSCPRSSSYLMTDGGDEQATIRSSPTMANS